METKNLNSEQWSQAIIGGQTSEMVAERIRLRKYQPWFDSILMEAEAARGLDQFEGGMALELGSGTGELSLSLMTYGFHVTLLDFSEEVLHFASQVHKRLNGVGTAVFKQADVTERLPFGDDLFDFVFSSGLLEHFDEKTQASILSEAFRVSRTSVMTLVPNASSMPYRLGKYVLEKNNQWRWGKEDPIDTLEGFYENIGIEEYSEWSVGERHALNFLKEAQEFRIFDLITAFYDDMESRGERLEYINQGYLLISVGYKKQS